MSLPCCTLQHIHGIFWPNSPFQMSLQFTWSVRRTFSRGWWYYYPHTLHRTPGLYCSAGNRTSVSFPRDRRTWRAGRTVIIIMMIISVIYTNILIRMDCDWYFRLHAFFIRKLVEFLVLEFLKTFLISLFFSNISLFSCILIRKFLENFLKFLEQVLKLSFFWGFCQSSTFLINHFLIKKKACNSHGFILVHLFWRPKV